MWQWIADIKMKIIPKLSSNEFSTESKASSLNPNKKQKWDEDHYHNKKELQLHKESFWIPKSRKSKWGTQTPHRENYLKIKKYWRFFYIVRRAYRAMRQALWASLAHQLMLYITFHSAQYWLSPRMYILYFNHLSFYIFCVLAAFLKKRRYDYLLLP